MKWGNLEIFEIDLGRFRLDGGAMFGTVPKPIWERLSKSDEQNRIELSLRALLIKKDSNCILIDAGMGNKWSDKHQLQYALRNNAIDDVLRNIAGVTTDSITHVILTHLHFDHCGGMTYKTSNGNLEPIFKKATVYLHAENLQTAEKPNARERASYLNENWEPYKKSGQIQLIQSKALEPYSIMPGIKIFRSDGHTKGHQCVLITNDDSNSIFFCGDLIPTSSHIRIPWTMGYDVEPLVMMKEKKILLEYALKERWGLYFEHDSGGALAYPQRDPDRPQDFMLEKLPSAFI